jgi:hypothetical protein
VTYVNVERSVFTDGNRGFFSSAGAGVRMYATGNSGSFINCSNSATVNTLGNNNMAVLPGTCTYNKGGGS